jgi:nucleotide-binding universal stress UspA family protein
VARPVLHPTDFSAASTPALRKAIEVAKGMRRPLLLVHVMASVPVVTGDYMLPPQVYDDLYRSMERDARRRLDRLVRRARAAGARVSGLLLRGAPHEQIVRTARGRRAELIVMGTHGRTGLRGALLGSVATRVLSQARCPVMTVRAKTAGG